MRQVSATIDCKLTMADLNEINEALHFAVGHGLILPGNPQFTALKKAFERHWSKEELKKLKPSTILPSDVAEAYFAFQRKVYEVIGPVNIIYNLFG